MRRADRLLDLVARLKAKPLARADDLAQAMEPSVRTIYRDICGTAGPRAADRGTGRRWLHAAGRDHPSAACLQS